MKSDRIIRMVVLIFLLTAIGVVLSADDSPLSLKQTSLEIVEPAERAQPIRDFPVAVGLVFTENSLQGLPGGRLVDDKGQTVPFEAEATGWWNPEKTDIKWLLLKFNASTDRRYTFEIGKKAPSIEGNPLAAEKDEMIEVNTGPLMARISTNIPSLFSSVTLNAQPIAATLEPAHVLTLDQDENRIETKVSAWKVEIEENSPARATLRAEGFFCDSAGEKVAALELRYQFFKGESFVRVYHTLTWMVKDPAIGAREISLSLKPSLGAGGRVKVGLSDYTTEAFETKRQENLSLYAHQIGPDGKELKDMQFALLVNGQKKHAGKQLGGWIAIEDEEGRGVGVVLREMWQMFPAAFSVKGDALAVEFWPSQGPRMGFEPEDLMPPDFYYDTQWNKHPWTQNKGHFVHERVANPEFLHTAEGVARTRELTIFFYDRTAKRTTPELNSVTQHPIALRQDPKAAMRVPFLGFNLEPVRTDYPDMERAVEQIGRLALARWPATHDYGLWCYGMTRWGGTGVCYRWIDGHKYDLQIIPWLLFMRGGGRHWFEEGEATARFSMDVGTNHYNTRGYPPGAQSGAAGMPFPWHDGFCSKKPKVHFLPLYHHLTGYRRAREVMQVVIAGNQQAADKDAQSNNLRRGWLGRELYNMLTFWALAYEETGSPEFKALSRECLDLTMKREYNPQRNTFRSPVAYLYPGLVIQHRLWNDQDLQTLMLKHLADNGYPDFPDGGPYSTTAASWCNWAFRLTGDRRYARAGWDVARSLADVIPDHEWSSRVTPSYYPFTGSAFFQQYLLPLLTGYADAARLGLKTTDPFELHNTFISLPLAGKGCVKGEVYLRPRQDGDLRIRFIFIGVKEKAIDAIDATVFDPDGRQVAQAVFPPTSRVEVNGDSDRFYPIDWFTPHRGELTLPAARRGATYRITLAGADTNTPLALVLAPADMVQRVSLDRHVYFYDLAGQYYTGTRIFTRTTAEEITVENLFHRPFTIRDAATGEVLQRFNLANPTQATFHVGKDQLIQVTVTGYMDARKFRGVSPFFAQTRDEWFEPPVTGN